MPPFGPIKRKDLIRHFKQFGFWVDVEQQTDATSFCRCLRVEDVGSAKAEIVALESLGVFVQQTAEIGRGPVRGRDCQQHGSVRQACRV